MGWNWMSFEGTFQPFYDSMLEGSLHMIEVLLSFFSSQQVLPVPKLRVEDNALSGCSWNEELEGVTWNMSLKPVVNLRANSAAKFTQPF